MKRKVWNVTFCFLCLFLLLFSAWDIFAAENSDDDITPGKPVVVEVTSTSLTLEHVNGYEYSVDGQNWQDGTCFKDLEPWTTYTVCQRVKKTDSQAAGETEQITATTLRAEEVPENYVGIYSAEDLDDIRNHLDGKFILMNDIVFQESDFAQQGDYYNSGNGWIPIGFDNSDAFSGIFNGNGYTLQGLRISFAGENGGCFGVFSNNGGIIRNLGLADMKINVSVITSGNDSRDVRVGSVAGYNTGTVSDCFYYGSIDSFVDANYIGNKAGGIVGCASGSIINCFNNGSVRAATNDLRHIYAGGISGYGGVIKNCYNTGRICSFSPDSTYANTFGISCGSKSQQCYSIDFVNKDDSNARGLYDATYVSEDALRDAATFQGFDFENDWVMNSKEGYPYPQLRKATYVNQGDSCDFSKGNGMAYDPYIIETKEQLQNMQKHLGAYYQLDNDISFSTEDSGWEPIGRDDSNSFFGSFDGNGHVIDGLTINLTTESTIAMGIFGSLQGVVQNFGTVNGAYHIIIEDHEVGIHEAYYAGGIAAKNSGVIRNCYNTNKLIITEKAASGSCYTYAGGISGGNGNGFIINCYNAGDVTINASRTGRPQTGGITSQWGMIQHCYNIGDITQIDSTSASPAGIAAAPSTIVNCYSKTLGAYAPDKDNTIFLEEDSMKTSDSFSGFDFENQWIMKEDIPYPYPTLRSVRFVDKAVNTTEFEGGNGKIYHPYLVKSAEQLKQMGNYLDAYFKLEADIDLSEGEWKPVGESMEDCFTGGLDGNGYVIRGLNVNVNQSKEGYAGLFGYSSGVIQNVTLEGGQIKMGKGLTNNVFVGGICGFSGRKGILRNCRLDGMNVELASNGAFVEYGGLVGYNCGLISDIGFKGTVHTDFSEKVGCNLGGIVGYNDSGTVLRCCSEGNIQGDVSLLSRATMYWGGIIGYNHDGQLKDAFHCGTIQVNSNDSEDDSYIGGIIGYNYNYKLEQIENVYEAGQLRGQEASMGYIFAEGEKQDLLNGFYLAGKAASNSYGTELSYEQMLDKNNYTGFDFDHVWMMDQSETSNYPLPRLRSVLCNAEFLYKLMDDCRVLPVESHIYTGNPVTPDVAVIYGNTRLKKNIDYTLTYENNIQAGQAYAVLKGIGAFAGTKKAGFVIEKKNITGLEVQGLEKTYIYQGEEIEPEISVKGLSGHDFIVSYANNLNVGMAEVTISGTGNYTGTIQTGFQIVPAEWKGIKCSGFDGNYDGKPHSVNLMGVPSGSAVLYSTVENGRYTTEVPYFTKPGRTTIYYRISNANYCDVYGSTEITIRPKAPGTVKADLYGHDDIKVFWTNVSGAEGYRIYYKKSAEKEYTKSVTTMETAAKFGNLNDGVKYDFKVVPYMTADGKQYDSKAYKTASTRTLKKVSRPEVKRYSSSKVKISWKNIEGETGYQISRSTKKNGTQVVVTYKTTKADFKVISSKRGIKYYYKVRAYKTVDGRKIYGPWSSTAAHRQ